MTYTHTVDHVRNRDHSAKHPHSAKFAPVICLSSLQKPLLQETGVYSIQKDSLYSLALESPWV